MNLKNITTSCYILTLFIRDDNERFLLGSGAYQFKDTQKHFAANQIVNDTVDVQGGDGTLLAGQVRRATKQRFVGYIGGYNSTRGEVENFRQEFFEFFRKNHFYEVVYIFPDGTAIKRQRGFIEDAPEVEELYQVDPEYSIAFNFEDVNYYNYYEDEEGNELYGQSAALLLYNSATGGYVFDAVGLTFDDLGAISEGGAGGTTTLYIDSVEYVYPKITITGPATNPRIENLTTGDKIAYDGTVTSGQTLVLDMLNQTALLNGANVLPNVSGNWLNFKPGANRVNYITDNNNAGNGKVEWQEVVA